MKVRLILAWLLVLVTPLMVSASFENLALGKVYYIEYGNPNSSHQESEKTYPDIDDRQLTDGQRAATVNYKDPGWVGFLRQESRIIEIDLGAVAEIKTVVISILQYKSVGISAPEYVEVRVSADGLSWSLDYWEPLPGEPQSTDRVEFVVEIGAKARFIEVMIPVGVWVFVDEIEVWGK